MVSRYEGGRCHLNPWHANEAPEVTGGTAMCSCVRCLHSIPCPARTQMDAWIWYVAYCMYLVHALWSLRPSVKPKTLVQDWSHCCPIGNDHQRTECIANEWSDPSLYEWIWVRAEAEKIKKDVQSFGYRSQTEHKCEHALRTCTVGEDFPGMASYLWLCLEGSGRHLRCDVVELTVFVKLQFFH